ncbi:chlororespiratory reduction protein 7 [Leptothoe spongobia]|uniref:Chlororespiratory reduction protein 7 n=1 Tax=Leptothoe spongobia TAU-MAC 1115 TaxID=1967444 RepID=A0A947DEH6_9CYAN|nr:chlororespiratory reduction protein 7 [Leptothoe spongobia]MBT9315169.1 chlororespiratory reduction protein 7 [Leptothoe spongobia TAU-MAC 1115]
MADATMYSEDMFVLLVPGSEEVFLEPDELLTKLKNMLAQYADALPRDLQKFVSVDDQARHLRDTACEFEVTPGVSWQWYAVRLEK